MSKNRKLAREQLQANLDKFQPLLVTPIPTRGWIRAIRDALGMSSRQLANRLGLSRQRVAIIEQQELRGTATVKTMRRIADALDCVFVYGFVPRTSLEQTLRVQAKKIAEERLARAAQMMRLEEQSLDKAENEKILNEMIARIIDHPRTELWNR